jgi:O-antigen/teichoic acid export membrane protein
MPDASPAPDGAGVVRNAARLAAAQAITAAISFGLTAVLARHLGAAEYGVLYLATAFVQSAFVLVEFGQEYFVVRAVARAPDRSGELLGTGLALRASVALVLCLPLLGAARLLGYSEPTRDAIAWMVLFHLLSSFANGFALVFRGRERMDVEAAARVAFRALVAAAAIAAVALGGRLRMVLAAHALGAGAALAVHALLLLRLGPSVRPRLNARTAAELVAGGAPFLLYSLVLSLHAAVEAILLSRLASADAVGWYGAATRFTGFLVFPATLFAAALYPTLARLRSADAEGYGRAVRAGLRWILLAGTPVAAAAMFYAGEAVTLVYGGMGFGPAADVLRLLAPYVLLALVDITLGTAVLAADRQLAWAKAKGAAVAFVALLNAVLVPYCQARFANGALGSAAATSAAEMVMLAAGVALVPRGVLNAAVLRDAVRAIAAAALAAVPALLLRDTSYLASAGAAAATYAAALVLLGAFDRGDLAAIRGALARRAGG